MKLKTINSSKQYEWHKHFLWIPKQVRLNSDISKIGSYEITEGEYEYSILWLEFVQRKRIGPMSINADDGKYNYWKKL